MSRNSRLKHTAKKKKKKGPGPGDRPRRVELDIPTEDPSIYKATDNLKENVKPEKSQTNTPITPPIRRAGPRGG